MLKDSKYQSFTSKEIKPAGWLKRQLEIQANGLSGNLDKIWPDVRDSRWVGGDKDGWERVPYWLDGFIPLAYLLDDEDMKSRAKRYIDAIIDGQKEDGWICPCNDNERYRYDMWACFLICKVLVVYYECSSDERVEGVLKKALYNLMLHIRGNTLFNWAHARWFECLIPIYWLYGRTGEDWLLYLAHMLKVQGTNYKVLFEDWRDQIPHTDWNYQTHVVNLAMALKAEILASRVSTKENAVEQANEFAKQMLEALFKYHGTAYGHFTGDENLSGDSPIQGSELCSVVEAMYSYEQMFLVTGDPSWMDRAEMLAFNALPATVSDDMWTHQYDQMVNQIACVRFKDKPIFGTNNQEAHLFGLEPNFGCCTANFNQGWPKFALSAFAKYDGGIISAAIIPSRLEAEVSGKRVEIFLDTEYPFKNRAIYTVKCEEGTEFELSLRIPESCEYAEVNGERVPKAGVYKIKKFWKGRQTLEVVYTQKCSFVDRPRDMKVLFRGPLLYSLSIEEQWKKYEYTRHGVERKFPYCDYEIYPLSKWNYAFAGDQLETVEGSIGEYPFSSTEPPVVIKVPVAEIDWGYEEGYNDVAAKCPGSRQPLGEVEIKVFKPYGCTNLRMTEMPKIQK